MEPSTVPATEPTEPQPPRWQPLKPHERRVAGVLVEKAKTTPDAYPMSLNALRTGCNQKSNRDPVTELEGDDIEEVLEHLRELGAVNEIFGGGRVARFRHRLYEWLGVDKVELAVIAELLLRGPQTVGELRGRAARMEKIADLGALRPILAALREKNLVVYLTPEGRGCIVTHNLYPPRELEKVLARHGGEQVAPPAGPTAAAPPAAAPPETAPPAAPAAASPAEREPTPQQALASKLREGDDLMSELESLRREVGHQKQQIDTLTGKVDHEMADLRKELEALGRQLGIL